MWRLIVFMAASMFCGTQPQEVAMFWNLENFFDWKDEGSGESDAEFSSSGSRHWTRGRFYRKCNAVAKTVCWTASQTGRLPDAIGFAEVENRFVLKSIAASPALKKYGYDIIHFDSDDPRGIDTGLLYRTSTYEKIEASAHKIRDPSGNAVRTRDMLLAGLRRLAGGDTVFFVVLHHPSKYGGEKASSPKRKAAMASLRALTDSLVQVHGDKVEIIVMGDFNDSPDGEAFSLMEGAAANLGKDLHRKGQGTICYEGKWELIDMFMVSPWLEKHVEMVVLRPPFLMVRDNAHAMEKPLRTYSGPAYKGGVSDHCPICCIKWENSGWEIR